MKLIKPAIPSYISLSLIFLLSETLSFSHLLLWLPQLLSHSHSHTINITNKITQLLRYYHIIHVYSFHIHLLARYFNQQQLFHNHSIECPIPIQQSNTAQ